MNVPSKHDLRKKIQNLLDKDLKIMAMNALLNDSELKWTQTIPDEEQEAISSMYNVIITRSKTNFSKFYKISNVQDCLPVV